MVHGLPDAYNGRSWLDEWVADPWTHGFYAAFRPDQYTRYYGFIGRPEGRVHFGGEHTSLASQGYLEVGWERLPTGLVTRGFEAKASASRRCREHTIGSAGSTQTLDEYLGGSP